MFSRKLLLILAVGIGIGAITVARLTSDDPATEGLTQHAMGNLAEQLRDGEPSEIDSEQQAQVLASLVQTLDNEISERRILAEELDAMRKEMTELQQNLRGRVEAAFSRETGRTTSQQPGAQANQTIEEKLAAAGFTPRQIEATRRVEAEARMRQIELDDRARREGWVNSPRYYEELNILTGAPDTVRRDLGDDAYDRYLFASGRPNRIAVGTIIETSAAEQAGLQPGDVLKSYAGERIFSGEQLVNLRSAGERGMPVSVEIIRDGQLMQITMPRGPMGITTRQDVVEPSAAGS